MDSPHQLLLERLSSAATAADVDRACQEFGDQRPAFGHASMRNAFREELATAIHHHLARAAGPPAYLHWLDTYFGRASGAYRSPLQQPSFLYYPSLEPVAWFEARDIAELAPLQPQIAGVAAELGALLEMEPALCPYVPVESARDKRWATLAANAAWSSLHLVRGGVPDEALLAGLPLTARLLASAPLADCAPHAPECFLSRLAPGVRIPPHFGLSNIKLTVHLPIRLPDAGCSITVAGESRQWNMGGLLVFDDSFEHSAANVSQSARTVLIFDIWHPGLAPEERAALRHTIRVLERVRVLVERLN